MTFDNDGETIDASAHMQNKAEELFESGKAAVAAGEIEPALKMLSMSLSYCSRPEAYLLKAQAELKRNGLKEALREVDNGLRVCNSDSEFYTTLTVMKDELNSELSRREKQAQEKARDIAKFKAAAVQSKSARAFATQFELPAVRMNLKRSDEKPNASSRLAGVPFVPTNFEWPTWKQGRRLNFICQINLGQLQRFRSIANSIPTEGMLSFFYDVAAMPWGQGPNEKDGWRVYRFPDVSKLGPAEDPEPCELLAASISWQEEKSYPDPMSDYLDGALSSEDQDEYAEFFDAVYEEKPFHRFLGYPQLIQYDLRQHCESASRGIVVAQDDVEGEKRLFTDSRDWRLLLQLDSDDATNMLWGDEGFLYFCIEERALAHDDFSNVWLKLQCT
jgi:uncharacterized protein YwqG